MKQLIYDEKQYDSVKTIGHLRDKISSDRQNMTFEEFEAIIQRKPRDNKPKFVGQP